MKKKNNGRKKQNGSNIEKRKAKKLKVPQSSSKGCIPNGEAILSFTRVKVFSVSSGKIVTVAQSRELEGPQILQS